MYRHTDPNDLKPSDSSQDKGHSKSPKIDRINSLKGEREI